MTDLATTTPSRQEWTALAGAARRAALPHSRPRHDPHAAAREPLTFADGPEAMAWFTAARLELEARFTHLVQDGDDEGAARFAAEAGALWEIAGYWRTWHDLHRDGLIAATTAGLDDAVRHHLLGLADALQRRGERDAAGPAYRRALAAAVGAADWWGAGFAHRGIALLALEGGGTNGAESHLDAAEECFRRCGDARGTAMVVHSRAALHLAGGEPGPALAHAEQAVAELAVLEDQWSLAWGRLEYGRILHANGEGTAAIAELEAAADVFDQFLDEPTRSLAFELLTDVAAATGQVVAAKRYRRAARSAQVPLPAALRRALEPTSATVTALASDPAQEGGRG
ncbi:hypothetical protein [Glycomyces sp. MUSA5-2]|uniref:hypothetical protein n=1 Tax=Glycomyces sp. MUSA5-2 TaxID=2053002 RepID=UPI00300A3D93